MKVSLGADHAGFPLKARLREQIEALGHQVVDVGTDSEEPVDFPDIVAAVCRPIVAGEIGRGVVVCGSGAGAVMAANKIAGIRCALAHEPYSAHQAVEHDDANVIALGSWLVPGALVPDILRSFFDAHFDDDEATRRRVAKLHDLEVQSAHRVLGL